MISLDRRTVVALTMLLVPLGALSAQGTPAPPAATRLYALLDTAGLLVHNVSAVAVTHAGKRGVRITVADDARRRLEQVPIAQQSQLETLALLAGSDFGNGVIEAEIAGDVAPGAAAGARGFVGVAFRVQRDMATYDAFYLRPTNGRADDQERRNHSAQYISHPAWPWDRLRRETPSRYESYVDLQPGVWTRIRIEVRGDSARLYVHDQPQPTLIVSDVKTGRAARGGVALWINPGTVAHFRDVRVTAAP